MKEKIDDAPLIDKLYTKLQVFKEGNIDLESVPAKTFQM